MKDILEGWQIDYGSYRTTVLKETGSTNTVAKEFARNGAPEGTVVVAGKQSAGRGRMGRSFFSPGDTGIYMSILERPAISSEEVIFLTTTAAVAVCEAIESVCGFKEGTCGIKWVNDIFIGGKKVCGILTESSFSTDKDGRPVTEFCVVGIGINCYEPEGGFPEDIKNTAGALMSEHKEGLRNSLCREILKRFEVYYKESVKKALRDREQAREEKNESTNVNCGDREQAREEKMSGHEFSEISGSSSKSACFEKYKARSIVLNREVDVISLAEGTERRAVAVDIDYNCRLTVRYPDGMTEVLSTGDVRLKSVSK